MEIKKKVEAVLFSIGKEISLEKLAQLCSLDEKTTLRVLEELKKEYQQRDHSLILTQRGQNYKLTIRDEFLPLVSKLVVEPDLDKALLETLAVIAWKYPLTQSEVVKLRHNKAYEHIRKLKELEFIDKEKVGRTYKLKLTKKFFEYFDLPSEKAKQAFLEKIPEKTLKKAEKIAGEIKEITKVLAQEKKEKEIRKEIKDALEKVRRV